MNHLTADKNICGWLRGVLEPTEIRDGKGKLLGVFTPQVSAELRAQYEKAKELFDLDEAQHIAATEREGLPLAEVWKRIHAHESQQ